MSTERKGDSCVSVTGALGHGTHSSPLLEMMNALEPLLRD